MLMVYRAQDLRPVSPALLLLLLLLLAPPRYLAYHLPFHTLVASHHEVSGRNVSSGGDGSGGSNISHLTVSKKKILTKGRVPTALTELQVSENMIALFCN